MKIKRMFILLLVLMALFALIRIGTSTYENMVRETNRHAADSTTGKVS